MRSRDQLIQDTEPFPDSLIEQVGPRKDEYVKWHEYAQRLLLQHPGHDYTVTDVTYAPSYTYPKKDPDTGRLTDELLWAPPVWAITVEFIIDGSRYGGVGEDDSPAAAESNAYKRALSHAGIGLHLYNRKGYWLHGRLQKDAGLQISTDLVSEGRLEKDADDE